MNLANVNLYRTNIHEVLIFWVIYFFFICLWCLDHVLMSEPIPLVHDAIVDVVSMLFYFIFLHVRYNNLDFEKNIVCFLIDIFKKIFPLKFQL